MVGRGGAAMIKVYGLAKTWDFPDASPYVCKLVMWLRLAGLDYELHYVPWPERSWRPNWHRRSRQRAERRIAVYRGRGRRRCRLELHHRPGHRDRRRTLDRDDVRIGGPALKATLRARVGAPKPGGRAHQKLCLKSAGFWASSSACSIATIGPRTSMRDTDSTKFASTLRLAE